MKRALLFLALVPLFSVAKMYPKPPENIDVIGEIKVVYAEKMDSLIDIGVRYEAGVDELKWANPGLNMWTLGVTQDPITLPLKFILPMGKRDGLVSNIPEMRTYYFPRGQNVVYSYPVSVGRMDWKTPLGTWKVTVKQKDPAWYPPASIRREHVEMGRGELPAVVPPGPDNPMGTHVLRLSIPSYLLHGTNDTTGIGMRVTHGCMRFYPDNIAELYEIVPSGTPVTFVNQPIKYGWDHDRLLIEVHPPLEEDNLSVADMQQKAQELLAPLLKDKNIEINMDLVRIAVKQMSGIPIEIGGRNIYQQGTYSPDEHQTLSIYDDNWVY